MPFRSIRRHWTQFGEIVERRKGAEKGSHLLITRGGKRLLLDFRKLLKAVKVEAVGADDKVTFSQGINPKFIGYGAHAKLFLLEPNQNSAFRRRSLFSKPAGRPQVVLKVYRQSLSPEFRVNGFGQFVAENAVYHYLLKQTSLPFVVRPLSYYFVSDKLTARRFVNAPTLEELRESFVAREKRRKPLSLALTDKEIDDFVLRHGITSRALNDLTAKLLSAMEKGQKANYGVNPQFPIAHDPSIKNFFILGKDNGNFIVSVFDQGKKPLHGISERMIQGTAL